MALLDKLPHSYFLYRDLIPKIYGRQDSILYDEESKENYVEIPYHNIRKFVPNQYYKQVHDDNQVFLAEKQVFCAPFFTTTGKLME
jgi:hypothetical protein